VRFGWANNIPSLPPGRILLIFPTLLQNAFLLHAPRRVSRQMKTVWQQMNRCSFQTFAFRIPGGLALLSTFAVLLSLDLAIRFVRTLSPRGVSAVQTESRSSRFTFDFSLASIVTSEPRSENESIRRGGESSSSRTEFDLAYYGWRVVSAACFGVMAGFGSLFVYTFTIFVKPLGAEFQWSREAISTGFGIAAMTLGFSSPLIGRLIDRLGPRRIILPCMTVFGCAIASLALLRTHLWQFYVTCLVIGVVGNGAAHLAYSRSISTWFQKRLGMALALVMLGAGLGAMILPVVAQSVVTRSGWRAAYITLGSLSLLLGLPLSWRYIHERGQVQPQSAPVVHSGLTWQQGLRSFAFWIIVAVLFVSSISMNGAITQLSALLTDRGISPRDAALCASVLGGSSVLGRIVVGWLLDRFFGARVALVVNLTTAVGIFLLARAASFPLGCLAAAFIGIGAGGEAAITPYLLTRYFGLRSFSTLYGFTWTFYAAAGAIGPVLLGRAFDSTGSYAYLLIILAAALALAAVMNLLLPKYSNSSASALS
jgi:MFS family permease